MNQWVEIGEQVARTTLVGDEVFYPLPANVLKPKFNPTDEPRPEYRGGDSGQGNLSVRRTSSQWTHDLEFYLRPIQAVGLLLKHALGKTTTRSAVDTSAFGGMLYPENQPFGTGLTLGDKALAIKVHYDDGAGGTKQRTYYGGRITKVSVAGEGSQEWKMTISLAGPGPCLSAPAAAGAVPDFSALPSPFVFSESLFYIGSGIGRTGVAPDFTALDPNTMVAFVPDSCSIDIDLGRSDKTVANGINAPTKTTKESQLAVKVSCPLDLEDPSTGFSSRDEVDALISGVRQNSLLVVLDNGEVCGSTTQTYQYMIDLSALYLGPAAEEFSTEGKSPRTTLEYSSLYSDTTKYAVGFYTVDAEATY
ncbi:hypothetical protein [Geopsychrobacter electrodiphilus]|uniref:hypothetical protein n=1 Tax=Geopsychrobacter electrodiphilus TaxID=225196 RepID=UPI0003819FD6|nr:hypothetical protein [Geopsychrobacter electrodiphilus]